MSSIPSIERHKSIHYVEEEVSVAHDQSFTVRRRSEKPGFEATGACPACGGHTSTILSFGIAGTKGFRSSARQPKISSTITIFCECGHAHTDRPADALDKGCGRFWIIDVPMELRVS